MLIIRVLGKVDKNFPSRKGSLAREVGDVDIDIHVIGNGR